MKPFTNQLYDPIATPYTTGISSDKNHFDQKRNLIQLKPGQHISVKVLPMLVQTSNEFESLELEQRKCKLRHETQGFDFLKEYTKTGCEFECAVKRAGDLCHCFPWYIPGNSTSLPICDMFGAQCFDTIMSDETHYKQCLLQCIEDCHEIALTTWPTIFPLDLDDLCKKDSVFDQGFKENFQQHFAFESYKTLVEGGSLPDLATRVSNGSLCKEYINNYVALLSVESPTNSIVKSKRESYTVTFNDQMGTIGGTLGLFTGMSLLSIIEVIFLFIILGKSLVQQIKEKFIDAVDRHQKHKNIINPSPKTNDSKNQVDNTHLEKELLKLELKNSRELVKLELKNNRELLKRDVSS